MRTSSWAAIEASMEKQLSALKESEAKVTPRPEVSGEDTGGDSEIEAKAKAMVGDRHMRMKASSIATEDSESPMDSSVGSSEVGSHEQPTGIIPPIAEYPPVSSSVEIVDSPLVPDPKDPVSSMVLTALAELSAGAVVVSARQDELDKRLSKIEKVLKQIALAADI
jgi:hypothetical protein